MDLPSQKLAADLIHDSSPQVCTDVIELSKLKRLVSNFVRTKDGSPNRDEDHRQQEMAIAGTTKSSMSEQQCAATRQNKRN